MWQGGLAPEDNYYKISTFLKKICIFFQNFLKNVINDLYSFVFKTTVHASLIYMYIVIKKNNLNCIDHFLV